ncbi:MAG: AI-2E family transporter [Bacteroidaceae bacterium]|nr:AI-2E family transporter [Bacteroidaceae bacterium]
MMTKEITFDRFIRALLAVAGLVLVYILMRKLSSVLIPFFVAWLVAYLLYPIVCFFQYKCKLKNRVLSIIVTLLIIIGIIIGACFLFVPPVISEVTRLKVLVIEYLATDEKVGYISSEIQNFMKTSIDFDKIVKALSVSDISAFVEQALNPIIKFMYGSVTALIGFIVSLIGILYLFFILMDYEKLSKGFFDMIPQSQKTLVSGIFKDVERGMAGYFRGQSLVALCVGILFAIGFVIIDFPLAIPLGLFIGFLNLVPYLQTLGFIPALMLSLLKAHDTGESFWVIFLSAVAVFAIVQTIQDTIIVPKVMGHVTGLNAAVILLSLSIWGSLLGFIGLIIALPLTTILISYYKRYVLEKGDDTPST